MKTLIAILLSLFIACSVQAKGLTLVFTEDQWTNPNYVSVPNGLVGYWPFNEGVGSSTADLSGFGSAGTLTGCTWGAGQNAGSLYFDGVDDYVDCGTGTHTTGIRTNLTVSILAKYGNVTGESGGIENDVAGGPPDSWTLEANSGSVLFEVTNISG